MCEKDGTMIRENTENNGIITEEVDVFSLEPTQVFMLTRIISDEDEFGTIASAIVQERYVHQIGVPSVTVRILSAPENFATQLRQVVNDVGQRGRLAGVLKYIGVWQCTTGEMWLVSERRNQVSLKRLCEESQLIDMESFIASVVYQVLIILRTMYRECVQAHGYVKAGNIHICKDGSICLSDAGIYSTLSKEFGTRLTTPGMKVWPMPQARRSPTGPIDSDIWDLGIAILSLMEGEAVLSRARRRNEPPPLHIIKVGRWSPQLTSFLATLFGRSGRRGGRIVGSCEQLLRHSFVNESSTAACRAAAARYWSDRDKSIGDPPTDDMIARLFRQNDVVVRAPLISVDDLSTDLFDYHTWQGFDSGRPTAESSWLRIVKVSKDIPLSRDVENVKSCEDLLSRLEVLIDTTSLT